MAAGLVYDAAVEMGLVVGLVLLTNQPMPGASVHRFVHIDLVAGLV